MTKKVLITDMAYADMVTALAKDPNDIMATVTTEDLNLLHAAVGIADEAGELVGKIKKLVIYGKDVGEDEIIEEIGDLKFYLQMVLNQLGTPWDDVDDQNRQKLALRYPEGVFTNVDAIKRRDKPGEGFYIYRFYTSRGTNAELMRTFAVESEKESHGEAIKYQEQLAADYPGSVWTHEFVRFERS